MKKILSIFLAGLALVMINDVRASAGGIPLSAYEGKYAIVGQGYITYCFSAGYANLESCSTAGALTAVASVVVAGKSASDALGNSCLILTSVGGYLGSTSPSSATNFYQVTQVTDYRQVSATGDGTFTDYSGGKCVGPTFDSTGATVLDSGTFHFVGSNSGNRIQAVTTSLTDSQGDVGAVSLSSNAVRQ